MGYLIIGYILMEAGKFLMGVWESVRAFLYTLFTIVTVYGAIFGLFATIWVILYVCFEPNRG